MNCPNTDDGIGNNAGFGDRYADVESKVEVGKRNIEAFHRARYSRHSLGAPDTRKVAYFGEGHQRLSQRVNDVAAAHNPRLIDAITGTHESTDLGNAFADN